jgi:hypothetical protein
MVPSYPRAIYDEQHQRAFPLVKGSSYLVSVEIYEHVIDFSEIQFDAVILEAVSAPRRDALIIESVRI